MWQILLKQLSEGNRKALARCISLVENEIEGYLNLLIALPQAQTAKIIGITGPPGAGKSTLVDGLIEEIIRQQKKVAVLCVDPSSPFNRGALLGDRIRMGKWYTHANVFIRSLASRGSLGGLHPKIIELTDVLKAGQFDYILVETVGVGQSEVEIAGLADVTVVVLVPETGDEIQTMKAGLMEIADVFVVNKADRPGADAFVKNLRLMLAPAFHNHLYEIPVLKTIASGHEGLAELFKTLSQLLHQKNHHKKRLWLLAEKAYYLIQQNKMKDVNREDLEKAIETAYKADDFNLYSFVLEHFLKTTTC